MVDLIRKEHMSANTVLHNVIIIAQFFRRHGRLNVTKELELPERISSLPKEYTEQLVRFFTVCTPAEKTLFTAFLMTGLREQEMVHLFWSDVNLRLRSIRVTAKPKYGFSPKRWEEREVPVPVQLIEMLAEHPRHVGADLVFPSRTGNREQNMLLRCKEVAGAPNSTPRNSISRHSAQPMPRGCFARDLMCGQCSTGWDTNDSDDHAVSSSPRQRFTTASTGSYCPAASPQERNRPRSRRRNGSKGQPQETGQYLMATENSSRAGQAVRTHEKRARVPRQIRGQPGGTAIEKCLQLRRRPVGSALVSRLIE